MLDTPDDLSHLAAASEFLPAVTGMQQGSSVAPIDLLDSNADELNYADDSDNTYDRL